MKIVEIILGTLTFISCLSAALLTVLVKRFIDIDKFKEQSSRDITKFLSHGLLPKDVLTPVGQRLWWWRNLAFVVMLTCVVIIVLWKQILR